MFHEGSMVTRMHLSAVQVRVLGALLEKAATTPEHYPLSSQALVSACNQRQNREPVSFLDESEVLDAVRTLRDEGLVRSVKRPGDRVMKHQHDLERSLGLDDRAQAALAVLMLRGAQTPGELRARTDRYVDFDTVLAVESTLEALAVREIPLVERLDRQPGHKEHRWRELLSADPDGAALAPVPGRATGNSGSEKDLTARVEALETEVRRLAALVAGLRGTPGGEAG